MNPRLLEIQFEQQAIDKAIKALQERRAALTQEGIDILTETVQMAEPQSSDCESAITESADILSTNDMPDFSEFKETTRKLFEEMWKAPDNMLSHEDIREEVIGDDEASPLAVRHVINRARTAGKEYGIEIVNIHGKGYQLITENVIIEE